SSPSKEMAWIGEMLVEGLAGAIERSGGDAVRASEGLAEDINDVMGQLGKDMSVALPTDFQVQAESAVSGALRGVAPIGSFPQITIEQMFVRSEDDIRKVSQELYNLIEAGSRAQGRFSPA
ncbi:MAG: phage tail protein, partial [Candidatus Cloacimonetes bacterium]|nr:phage tail protein [Candidatus Cloacimonadota bacterium]